MSIVLIIIGAGLLGVLAGGLVNACLLRTRDGLAFTFGRKKCVTCARPMAIADHVPVASYIRLKGKCRRCSAVIPWQYPAVELAIGLLFAGFAYMAWTGVAVPTYVELSPWYGEPLAFFIRNAIMAMLLVPIFMFDFRASVIPDRLSIPAVVIALLMNLALGASSSDLLLGGLGLGSFFAVQFLASRGTWVGGGDVRMGLLIGFLLGFELGLVALLLSYVLGSLAGLYLIMSGKRELHSHVPFGTFLVIGTFAAMFWGEPLLDWYLGFFT
ncbi:MAG: prepilin peptidase [Candidatus Uhrbacteria bacterium]|nr:prepilin peptidase [Candidatus Uhrbacteria bacterium]